MRLVEDVMKLWPNVNAYLGYLDPPFVKFLPSHWVAEFLYWSLQGNVARALPYFSLLFLTMLGLIVVAGLMARRFYYESWLAVADVQAASQSRKPVGASLFDGELLKPQWDVLLKRDIVLFLREPSQWMHLALMFSLLTAFLISLATLHFSYDQPAAQATAFLTIFMFVGFLIASVALRFVFPAVSLEGDAFWCVRTSPLHVKKLYWYKTLAAFGSVALVAPALAFVSVSVFHHDRMLAGVASVAALCISLALVGLNVGAGSYFAMYKEKNPIRVASSQGASLTFLASMMYLTIVVAILLIPLNRYFVAAQLVEVASPRWAYTPLTIVAILSLAIFSAATSLGLRAIRRSG
jgi:ABC-2 type transport system permease protein